MGWKEKCSGLSFLNTNKVLLRKISSLQQAAGNMHAMEQGLDLSSQYQTSLT